METTQMKVWRKQNLKRLVNNCFSLIILFTLVQIMILLFIDYSWNLAGLHNQQVTLYALKKNPFPN